MSRFYGSLCSVRKRQSNFTIMRASVTSVRYGLVNAFHSPLVSKVSIDREHWLFHHPMIEKQCSPGCVSLSSSGVLNRIPLAHAPASNDAARASPASPLYPDTLRRYLSASGPSENDEYSAEVHSPVSFLT